MTCRPLRHKTEYRNVRMTCVTHANVYTHGKYNIKRTSIGARLMKEIGKCIADGGAVTFEQWFEGYEEYANATLVWEQQDDNDE